VDLFFKGRRRKKERVENEENLEANLVHQSGNGVLESLGEGGEGINVMSLVGIKSALGTHRSLVSLAVRVDLILRMLLTMKNPGGR